MLTLRFDNHRADNLNYTIMTAEELRQKLKSPENRRALKAVDIITNLQPIAKLRKVLALGCPDVYYVRPPRTRTKYRVEHVIDACFRSDLKAIPTGPTSALITPVTEGAGREPYFQLLLERGFIQGSNNWRGPLFKHILSGCFYADNAELHRSFARILVQYRKEELTRFALHDYAWLHRGEHLEFLNELGIPSDLPGLLANALRYVHCDCPYGIEGRLDVVRRIVDAGGKLADPMRDYEWNRAQIALATDTALLSRVVKLRAELVPQPA